MNHPQPNVFALTPFLLFLCIFIGSGIYFTLQGNPFGFYQITPAMAALPALALALWMRPSGITNKLAAAWQGASNSTVLAMCLIFILAGAFTQVAKNTGGVEATVALGLNLIPAWFLLPGFFLITAFISTAMGTSTGTIAAAAPVALGVAQSAGIPIPLMAGVVLSGAMFGDNLSIISDTTIAATRSQDCAMIDKFKENVIIAAPAAILVVGIFFLLSPKADVSGIPDYEFIKIVPYLVILILALLGMNVFLVLATGILTAGCIGMFTQPAYLAVTFITDIGKGIWAMHDIVVLSLLLGALGSLMERAGGIAFLLKKIEDFILKTSEKKGQRSEMTLGELGIAGLVSGINLCTANNTIAIIVSARAAKHIAERYEINKRRSASLLDIFSCVIQGLIPWGAQILLLGTSFKIDPVSISPYSIYPIALGVIAIGFIVFKPR